MTEPRVIVVMGVAGSGKSTVGRLLAARLGGEYAEGDDFHTPQNVAKMADGTPLTDEDRRPWLAAIRSWITDHLTTPTPSVVACSALKRSYRAALGLDRPGTALVYLCADPDTLAARLHGRTGHFFRPRMLESQLNDLEPPTPDEALIVLSDASPTALATRIAALLRTPR